MSSGSEPPETSQGLNQSLSDGSTPQTSSLAQPKDQTSRLGTPLSDSCPPPIGNLEKISNENVNDSNHITTDEYSPKDSTLLPKRKLISDVWNHFKRQNINGLMKAICNYCEKKLGFESKNGTNYLREYWKRCPLRNTRDIRQSILNPNKVDKENYNCYFYI
ncbi:Zinc finger, BED-type [Parasponia andersonii]|uniref:Zinc finger, BED-type n=1 Tax=Parasponia andersonii TaxID=3476 RepID=A0A2P5DFN6_PARAD|nr:Zinc finger, BED-type [Parasponia andersonii]